jgi:cytochrome c
MKLRTVALALIPFLGLITGCTKGAATSQRDSVPDKITRYGCPTCHVIPGVPGAVGKVGPSLDGLGQRSYLAGRLSNDESNLSTWLMHPQHIEPGVAMPEMGVTQEDARLIAAFLERSR